MDDFHGSKLDTIFEEIQRDILQESLKDVCAISSNPNTKLISFITNNFTSGPEILTIGKRSNDEAQMKVSFNHSQFGRLEYKFRVPARIQPQAVTLGKSTKTNILRDCGLYIRREKYSIHPPAHPIKRRT